MANNALVTLGLTAALSAADREIYNGSLLWLSYPDLLIKVVTKTVKNETDEQRSRFLCILLGTFGAGLLGNMLEECNQSTP